MNLLRSINIVPPTSVRACIVGRDPEIDVLERTIAGESIGHIHPHMASNRRYSEYKLLAGLHLNNTESTLPT